MLCRECICFRHGNSPFAAFLLERAGFDVQPARPYPFSIVTCFFAGILPERPLRWLARPFGSKELVTQTLAAILTNLEKQSLDKELELWANGLVFLNH